MQNYFKICAIDRKTLGEAFNSSFTCGCLASLGALNSTRTITSSNDDDSFAIKSRQARQKFEIFSLERSRVGIEIE